MLSAACSDRGKTGGAQGSCIVTAALKLASPKRRAGGYRLTPTTTAAGVTEAVCFGQQRQSLYKKQWRFPCHSCAPFRTSTALYAATRLYHGPLGVHPTMLGAIPWVLLSIPFASAMAEFFVPGPPPYQRWRVGEVQKIRFRTTYTKYTIALWQQLNGAAKPGPILFRLFVWPKHHPEQVVLII